MYITEKLQSPPKYQVSSTIQIIDYDDNIVIKKNQFSTTGM